MKVLERTAIKLADKYAHRANPAVYMKTDLTKLNENEKTLRQGVIVKDQVVPQLITLEGNKKQIGFIQANHHTTTTADMPDQYNIVGNEAFKYLKARIFFKDINHMHMTPTTNSEGYSWVVQFQRTAMLKSNAMGWAHTNPCESIQVVFGTEVEAIQYCQEMGWQFEVSYPHFRYHMKKAYSDNSKWKGYPTESIEEF